MPRRAGSSKAPDADHPVVEGFPLTFDQSKGRLFISGMPAWFMAPHYYVDMQAQLETLMGKAAKGVLYRVAEKAGIRLAMSFGAKLVADGDDPRRLAILLRMAEFMPSAGHGTTELVIGDIGKLETTWTMPNSYIAELHEPSDEPVCHFYAGAIAGAVSVTFGRTVRCDEIECRAKGEARCVFRTSAT